MKTHHIFSTAFLRSFLALSLLSVSAGSMAQSGGGIFTTGPTMHKARIDPAMANLDDGRIATFGGREYNFVSCQYADIYNPTTNTYAEIAMNYPHDMGAIVKLTNGKYFIIGGSMDLGVAPGYATTEIFDPVANTFTPSGSMNYARCWMGAAQLASGKVLIAGAWYNTPGATYGDVYDIGAATYTPTNAMVQPRANPIILPTDDGGAMVLGGYASYGGTNYTSVEYYSSTDNSFHAVSSEIIASEPGWLAFGAPFQRSPNTDYKMSNGKYLIGASNGTAYALITFDPATKAFSRITTSAPIMDAYTNGGFYDVVLDKVSDIAYLLGVDSGYDPIRISLVAVSLTTGQVYHPGSTFTMPASEYLYPNMAFIPSNGKILLEGVSSTSGDYFHATNKTYLVTPQPVLGVQPITTKEQNINCYPNPANNTLNFQFENRPAGAVAVVIYDLMGRIVEQQSYNDASPVISISLNAFPAGMYIYEVNNNGTVTRNKFIRQ